MRPPFSFAIVGIVLAILTTADVAAAQEDVDDGAVVDADPTFGPLLTIERVEVRGNRTSAARLIERALPVHPGDVLRAGDRRLRDARFKVLALGYFRDVALELRRGSRRGAVVLVVRVVERGTVVLNLLQFGSSKATPWWAGVDVTERNFAGTGLGLGGGVVHAADSDIDGAGAQWAAEIRLADHALMGTRIGVHGSIFFKDASEPYRVAGRYSELDNDNFRAFGYTRFGAIGGAGFALTPLSHLSADLRAESIDAAPPSSPTRTLEDGAVVGVEIPMKDGRSRVVAASVGFDRDTRADPVLPFGGDRLVLVGEVGYGLMGSDYDFAKFLARYQHWWGIRGRVHVVSVHLTGGLILGDPVVFDKLYVADVNRLLTPRASGLVVSTQTPREALGSHTAGINYGEVGASAAVEYSYRLFRRNSRIYGGDLFVGTGLWGLSSRRDLSLSTLPIGVFVDAGLRIDTEVGIFELTLANALGRVPL